MNLIFKLMSVMMLAITIVQVQCSDQRPNQEFHTVWLPGLNGGYGANSSLAATDRPTICTVIQPCNEADLGQVRCIKDLDRQLAADDRYNQSNNKVIAIGSSQGGGTWMNKIAQMTHKDQEDKIAVLVLEAPLANANDAILHNMGKASYLPFAQFWAPRGASWIFQGYNCQGMQATESAKKISPNIPVIIAHSTKDPETPINSTRRLICELLRKRQGKPNNVYYIEERNAHPKAHVNFFTEKNKSDFHAISKKLALPHLTKEITDTYQESDFAQFQPSIEKLEKDIRNSTWRSRFARNVIDAAVIAGVGAGIYCKFFKGNKKTA